jgi:hypothetical protein
MSVYRPAFEAALRLFAEVSEAMLDADLSAPILVGGGAVELYSGSAVMTGDFDLVTGRQDAFEALLRDKGFVRPSGPGVATRGWVHPELQLGFEVVSDRLLDGNADRSRVRLLDAGEGKRFAVISIEDLIADRMGQYASGTAADLLEQARTLYRLSERIDRSYLDRRIREETAGDHGIEIVEG